MYSKMAAKSKSSSSSAAAAGAAARAEAGAEAVPSTSSSTGRMPYTSNLGSSEFCLPWSQEAYNFGSFTTTPAFQPDNNSIFDQGLNFFCPDLMTSDNSRTDAEIIRVEKNFLEQAEILEKAIERIPTIIQKEAVMQLNDMAEATNEESDEARASTPVTREIIDTNNNSLKDEKLFVNIEQELYKIKAELDLDNSANPSKETATTSKQTGTTSKQNSTTNVRAEPKIKKPVLRNKSNIPPVLHFNGYQNYFEWQMMMLNNSLMNHHLGQFNNNYLPFTRANVIDVHHYHYPEHLFEQIFPKNPETHIGYSPEYIAQQACSMGMPICDENIFSPESLQANLMMGPNGQPQFPTMLHHFKVPEHLQEVLKTKTLILKQVCSC
ncbi:uncharacterized protein LOC122503680 [Leptopilina heterotoma]|uniref:uncharacterized protein LOC122503680 n=1 Tax=Leptopilina heterotoma TaxID=63436 RepID=UPI001CA7DBE7|nr:uncharacterized protein LOC122503680 [Leptopilina heterotoma]